MHLFCFSCFSKHPFPPSQSAPNVYSCCIPWTVYYGISSCCICNTVTKTIGYVLWFPTHACTYTHANTNTHTHIHTHTRVHTARVYAYMCERERERERDVLYLYWTLEVRITITTTKVIPILQSEFDQIYLLITFQSSWTNYPGFTLQLILRVSGWDIWPVQGSGLLSP